MNALFLVLFASGFLIVGFFFYNKGQHLLQKGKKAEAIILKNNRTSGQNGPSYHPVVRFITDRNEVIIQELSIGYTTPKTEGSKVEVLYDPLNPTVVEFNASLQLKTIPKIFIGVGLALLLTALFIAVYNLF